MGSTFSLFERGHVHGSPLQSRRCKKKVNLGESQNKLSCKAMAEIRWSSGGDAVLGFIVGWVMF